jgi:hypothetical protein
MRHPSLFFPTRTCSTDPALNSSRGYTDLRNCHKITCLIPQWYKPGPKLWRMKRGAGRPNWGGRGTLLTQGVVSFIVEFNLSHGRRVKNWWEESRADKNGSIPKHDLSRGIPIALSWARIKATPRAYIALILPMLWLAALWPSVCTPRIRGKNRPAARADVFSLD